MTTSAIPPLRAFTWGGRTLQIQHCYSNKPYPMKNSAWFPTPSLPQSSENKWVLKAVFCFHPQLEWPGYVFVALWGFGLECGYREESCLEFRELMLGLKVWRWGRRLDLCFSDKPRIPSPALQPTHRLAGTTSLAWPSCRKYTSRLSGSAAALT